MFKDSKSCQRSLLYQALLRSAEYSFGGLLVDRGAYHLQEFWVMSFICLIPTSFLTAIFASESHQPIDTTFLIGGIIDNIEIRIPFAFFHEFHLADIQDLFVIKSHLKLI